MKNNKKTILLILITITTLILLSTASATTDTNTSTTTSSIKEKTNTVEPVVKEKIENTQTKELKTDKTQDKTITKTNKTKENTKTTTKTIEVYDSQSFTDAISLFITETWDEGIIELKEGTYDLTGKQAPEGTGNTKKIIINGNNQTIICPNTIYVEDNHDLIINNLNVINTSLDNWGGNLIINNSTIYVGNSIGNYFGAMGGNTIINDNSKVTLSDSILIYWMGGTFYTNDTTIIQKLKEAGCPDENIITISSKTIEVTDAQTLNDALTLFKSTETWDEGIIELKEGSYNLTGKQAPEGTGNTKKIIINGNNQTIICPNTIYVEDNHDLIINNLNVINTSLDNWGGNLIINNSTIYVGNSIGNYFGAMGGNTIINDNSKVTLSDSILIYWMGGTFYTNDTTIIQKLKEAGCPDENINPEQEEDTRIIENKTINVATYRDNVQLINCNITGHIKNYGTLTLLNCRLSNVEASASLGNALLIDNYGNLTMTSCIMENNTYNGQSIDQYTEFGMIYNNATLVIDNCTFQNNRGRIKGGVIYAYNNPLNNIVSNTNIVINNSVFRNNSLSPSNNPEMGGREYNDGGAICLTGANLTVSNTLFENHHVATSNRNAYVGSGAAIYLEYTNSTFDNTTFNNNSYKLLGQYDGSDSGYGAGISSRISNLTVVNSYFNDNWVDSLATWASTEAVGAAIGIETNWGCIILIENNTFNNNHAYHNLSEDAGRGSGGSISIKDQAWDDNIKTDITIQKNIFNNNSASNCGGAIWAFINNPSCIKININNNTFNNIEARSETIYLAHGIIYSNQTDYNIYDNIYDNCSFSFSKYDLVAPEKVYSGDNISIKLEIELEHPEYYDQNLLEDAEYTWYITGDTTTTKETEMNITVTEDNIITYAKFIKANSRTKTLSIIPTILNDIIITPENINKYLFERELIVAPNSRIIFQGEFTDIGEIFNNKNEVFIDGSQATFTNTYFTIEANNNTLQNMNIKNKNTSKYIITITGNDTIITNNKITTYNNNGQTAAIYNTGINNKITHNTINVTGPALAIGWVGTTGVSNTQAILSIGGQNNQIEYNNITIQNSTDPELESFSNMEAITLSQETNTSISYNNIIVTGARFNYGINALKNINENNINNNNITVTGYRYADGIQVGNGATNNLIANNNIEITCLNDTPVDEAAISYGIIVTNQGGTISNNNTVTQNNININGAVTYGMEIYETSNTWIIDNNITLSGVKSMGIGFAHSPNATVANNTIKTNDDSIQPLNGITEEIQPKNTGIQIQQDSENILIQYNVIQTYDKSAQDSCINVESKKVSILDNNLTSSTKTGFYTIIPQYGTVIDNNNAIEQNSTTQTATEDLTIGESTALTAQFYDDTYTPAGDGKAIFRVNGKTLRYDNGEIIYANVINGRAELPNINITQEWMKPDTTIQAVYMGDNNNEPIITEKTTVNVTKPEATITLETPTTATAGQEITLKANVTDGDTAINSGRVAFKLNGKTLKNAEGKALYANVENGVATIQYTIPEKTKAKKYVLTAVFTDNKYDRKETNSTLNVVKA